MRLPGIRQICALAVFALLFSLACGPAVDSGMAGSWEGPVTVAFPGYAPFSYRGRMTIETNGDRVVARGVCPGGGGSITATGSGRSARWTGQEKCSPVPVEACSTVVLTYSSAAIELGADGLTAKGDGLSVGCGIAATVEMTFAGRRPSIPY